MTNLIDSCLLKIGFHQVFCENSNELLKQNILSVLNTNSTQNIFIGFSGGSMPQLLAPLLNELSNDLISNLLLFPVDERLVPLQNEESNAGSLLKELSTNKERFENKILKISEEPNLLEDGPKMASEFENKLRLMHPKLDDNGFPIFGIILINFKLKRNINYLTFLLPQKKRKKYFVIIKGHSRFLMKKLSHF
uniref:Glucosamine/galactosamine-6-phosphate isomerase domain-containing protein n=1 Tax=Meloidogyne enterolobii TaxID=390850 RepID=A0A6V7Y4P4_MELEN|nr:unnamed protein product [Meloidogyne enterolobii]